MTAPTMPVNAPAELSQSGPFGVEDALASISKDAITQTLTEIGELPSGSSTDTPAAPAGDQPRGPDGKFVPREGTPATPPGAADPAVSPTPGTPAVPAVPAVPGTPEAATDEPVVLPDGFVAIPAVTGRELATAFKVLDAQGELDVPDLSIEFRANGKTRKEPLDQVVRLAERGVYNEEREQAVLAQKQDTQRVTQENAQLRTALQRLAVEREALLSSDDAYLTARAQFEAQNTPEAQMERLKRERAQEQQQSVFQQAVSVSNQYFEQQVVPAVTTIAEKFGTVTADEIGARLVLLTNHLRVPMPDGDSFIPPAAHQAVTDIVLREIVPWASALHEDRDSQTNAQRDAAERARTDAEQRATQAQVDAQKAKSLVGRQTRPTGRATTSTPNTRDPAPQKPIRTVEDAEQAALRDTLAAMAG